MNQYGLVKNIYMSVNIIPGHVINYYSPKIQRYGTENIYLSPNIFQKHFRLINPGSGKKYIGTGEIHCGLNLKIHGLVNIFFRTANKYLRSINNYLRVNNKFFRTENKLITDVYILLIRKIHLCNNYKYSRKYGDLLSNKVIKYFLSANFLLNTYIIFTDSPVFTIDVLFIKTQLIHSDRAPPERKFRRLFELKLFLI